MQGNILLYNCGKGLGLGLVSLLFIITGVISIRVDAYRKIKIIRLSVSIIVNFETLSRINNNIELLKKFQTESPK